MPFPSGPVEPVPVWTAWGASLWFAALPRAEQVWLLEHSFAQAIAGLLAPRMRWLSGLMEVATQPLADGV